LTEKQLFLLKGCLPTIEQLEAELEAVDVEIEEE
jgi:hypothetical protein